MLPSSDVSRGFLSMLSEMDGRTFSLVMFGLMDRRRTFIVPVSQQMRSRKRTVEQSFYTVSEVARMPATRLEAPV